MKKIFDYFYKIMQERIKKIKAFPLGGRWCEAPDEGKFTIEQHLISRLPATASPQGEAYKKIRRQRCCG
jgi:hypothetical protein